MNDRSLEELKEILEFGKYGFRGTLWTGICGMILILSLAALDAFTDFSITGWELVTLAFIILTGSISFGYLSLRKLPQLNLNIKDGNLVITSTKNDSINEKPNKESKGSDSIEK